MAFSADTAWEVRSTGNDANGGGFNISATGTDYSQQDSPQVAYTDLVIGTPNTHLTSVATPFTSAHVGNVINIVSGTGFTVQRIQVVSVAAGVATMDKACGTIGSVGGTGNLGGGLATIPTAVTTANVAGNSIWIQTATYTITSSINFPTSIYFESYATTHGDQGSATITTSTNSISIFNQTISVSFLYMANLIFSTTATTRSTCYAGNNTGAINMVNCLISGFTTGVSANINMSNSKFIGCGFIGNTASGITYGSLTTFSIENCYFDGNAKCIIGNSTSNGNLAVKGCVFVNSTSTAMDMTNSGRLMFSVDNCTFANNGGSGLILPTTFLPSSGNLNNFLVCRSNIFYGNALWGITSNSTTISPGQFFMSNNAYGANGSGDLNHVPASASDVTLTSNPFTSSSDFSLNTSSGGGASCRGAGYPGLFVGSMTTGHIDIGAVQSSSGGSISNYGYSG